MDVNNKIIVVIGSEGLLGKVIVSHLLNLGMKVVSADKALTKDFTNCDNSLSMSVDITDHVSIKNLIETARKEFNRIDCLINVSYPKSKTFGQDLELVSYNDFCENLNLHLGGYFIATKSFAKFFEKQGFGNVINFASIYGTMQPKFEIYRNSKFTNKFAISSVEYAAIKSAIIHLSRYFAKYYKGKNIRFNTVSPGGIEDDQDKNFKQLYKEHCLNKGMLDPEDILGILEYLISDNSKYFNGQNIIIDDGFSL